MKSKLSFEIVAIILAIFGIILGIYFPTFSTNTSFVGTIFILLLKMLIIPLVVTSIYLSIVRLGLQQFKFLGGKTVIYYLSTSSLACLTGLMISNFFSFSSSELDIKYDPSKLANISFGDFFSSFFTGNFFNALTEGNLVQIVVFTIFVSIASLKISQERRDFLIKFSESIQDVMMVIISWVLFIAPIGVCSLIASIIAKTELSTFSNLSDLFLAILTGCLIHLLITLPAFGYFFGRFNPYKFILNIKKPILVSLTTASSTATLPVSMKSLDDQGVSVKTSRFVLPLGATLNMDGSALYQSIVLIFLASFSGIDLSVIEQLLIFVFVMTSSAGTAGIPGGGIMMMGAVMEMIGIPLENIALYLLIDRFWDYPVTSLNVIGDLFGAKCIDRYIRH